MVRAAQFLGPLQGDQPTLPAPASRTLRVPAQPRAPALASGLRSSLAVYLLDYGRLFAADGPSTSPDAANALLPMSVAMITGQNDHGIRQPPLRLQKLYQATEMIVDLLDQSHIGWNDVVTDVIALKTPALFVVHKRGHYRMRLVAFSSMSPGWHNMLGTVHITIRRRCDIGPVWFDIAQMQAPGTRPGLANVLHSTIGHIGRFGVCFDDPRWQVGVGHIPATQHLTVWSLNRVGKIVPGVVADIASGAQVTIIGQIWISTLIRMQAVIAFVRLKTALADEDAQGGHWIDLQPCHAGVIGAHVGLADLHCMQGKRT